MSSARRAGLPETLRMRHDTHFVDHLARSGGSPVGKMLAVEDIHPNPNQPRQAMGNLSELIASVREKGILEPILVRRGKGDIAFEIIAGERRYRAAIEAGLDEVPCVIRDTDDAEMMELALIENLQRKDLTPFEEAEGLKVLAETHGYTHETMAERLGKSRTSITETLSLNIMPEQVRELCRLADISSKSLLLQVVRQSDPKKMIALVERLQQEGTTRKDARRIAKQSKGKPGRGRPKNYVFRYQPPEKAYTLSLQFRRSEVARSEVIEALQKLLEDLSNSPDG